MPNLLLNGCGYSKLQAPPLALEKVRGQNSFALHLYLSSLLHLQAIVTKNGGRVFCDLGERRRQWTPLLSVPKFIFLSLVVRIKQQLRALRMHLSHRL